MNPGWSHTPPWAPPAGAVQHAAEGRGLRRSGGHKLAEGDMQALELRGEDRRVYLAGQAHLKGLKIRLDVAAREYAEAKRIVKNADLRSVASSKSEARARRTRADHGSRTGPRNHRHPWNWTARVRPRSWPWKFAWGGFAEDFPEPDRPRPSKLGARV